MSDNFKITMAAARVNAGMTQNQVAEALHVSNKTIVKWENGYVIPRFIQLKAFCDVVNVPIERIFLPKPLTKNKQ